MTVTRLETLFRHVVRLAAVRDARLSCLNMTGPGLLCLSLICLSLLCVGLQALAPAKALAQATTIGRPFSGDAGSQFEYVNFIVAEDRSLTGTLINRAPRARRDVVVEVTAIGLESRAPLWSVKQRFSDIPPDGSVNISANYGRFTAEPGAFTFKFTESSGPPPKAEAEQPPPSETPPSGGEDSPTRNVCSSIYSQSGSYVVEGTGNCDSVSFHLEAGTVRFEITRNGGNPITVSLLDNEKQFVASLVADSTYRTTKASAKIPQVLSYRLQVAHEGKWTIRVTGQGLHDLGGPPEGSSPDSAGPGASGAAREPQGKRFEIILE